VGHEVKQEADAGVVQVAQQGVEVGEVPEQRVDVRIIGDVVAEVGHGGGKDRRKPHGADAELLQVADAPADAFQIAHAVAVRILERAGIDLVNDTVLPPFRGFAHASSFPNTLRGASHLVYEGGQAENTPATNRYKRNGR